MVKNIGIIVKVAIENLNQKNDILYSYKVSNTLADSLKLGCSVIIPFGKNNNKRQGLVLEMESNSSEENLKEIYAVLDMVPPLSREMIQLIKWIKARYFCTYYEAIKLVIPKGLGGNIKDIVYSLVLDFNDSNFNDEEKVFLNKILKSNKNYFSIEEVKKLKIKNYNKIINSLISKNLLKETVSISEPKKMRVDKLLRLSSKEITPNQKLSEKQIKVCEFLKDKDLVSSKEIRYFLGITDSIIKTLVKKQILEEVIIQNNNYDIDVSGEPISIILSNEQNEVYQKILDEYKKNIYKVSLIRGVTGSGKTQIMLYLIDYVLSINKSVIFLVPEIALTAQFIKIFVSRYKEKVAVIHSGISDSKKSETWDKIKNKEVRIVLGARSAIFAPFDDLGIVIMDEEHESSYKSESSPRFDTKEIAKFRCNYNKCMLVLSSATPSIETYYMAKIGKYSLYELNNRYGNALLPTVEIVDMNGRYNKEGEILFSNELINELKKCIDEKKTSNHITKSKRI